MQTWLNIKSCTSFPTSSLVSSTVFSHWLMLIQTQSKPDFWIKTIFSFWCCHLLEEQNSVLQGCAEVITTKRFSRDFLNKKYFIEWSGQCNHGISVLRRKGYLVRISNIRSWWKCIFFPTADDWMFTCLHNFKFAFYSPATSPSSLKIKCLPVLNYFIASPTMVLNT